MAAAAAVIKFINWITGTPIALQDALGTLTATPSSSYTVATVPAAADYTGALIYVTNEAGGAVPAFSDGTNWRRVTDRAIIS